MSESNLSGNSKTDWTRIDAMSDAEIDTSDIPPLDENFFANAEVRMPKRKESITIRLDPDVLSWFRNFGKGYQTRINAVLRAYMETINSDNFQRVHEAREEYKTDRVPSRSEAPGKE